MESEMVKQGSGGAAVMAVGHWNETAGSQADAKPGQCGTARYGRQVGIKRLKVDEVKWQVEIAHSKGGDEKGNG